jgi:hypothetical protein
LIRFWAIVVGELKDAEKMKQLLERMLATGIGRSGTEAQVNQLAKLDFYCTLTVNRTNNIFAKGLTVGLGKWRSRVATKEHLAAVWHNKRNNTICLVSNFCWANSVWECIGDPRRRTECLKVVIRRRIIGIVLVIGIVSKTRASTEGKFILINILIFIIQSVSCAPSIFKFVA